MTLFGSDMNDFDEVVLETRVKVVELYEFWLKMRGEDDSIDNRTKYINWLITYTKDE